VLLYYADKFNIKLKPGKKMRENDGRYDSLLDYLRNLMQELDSDKFRVEAGDFGEDGEDYAYYSKLFRWISRHRDIPKSCRVTEAQLRRMHGVYRKGVGEAVHRDRAVMDREQEEREKQKKADKAQETRKKRNVKKKRSAS